VLLAAASDLAATAAGRTASAVAVAFGPRAPPASVAPTCNSYRPAAVDGQYHAVRTANPCIANRSCLASFLCCGSCLWVSFVSSKGLGFYQQ